ncbi:MAG: serine/threonine protein kinase, partial [Bradymonadaceae bacterium]
DRIGQRDCVKVLDFGVAKSVALEQRGDADLTVEGAIIGTPKYMSPEQLQGQPLSPASDLFSVGILAYLMYAGSVPYDSNTPGIILDQMREFADDLGEMEGASEPLKSVVGRLLAPHIDERFVSAQAAIEALEAEPSSSSETARPLEHGGADRSATFPMGFDPEGGMESTELTGVDTSGTLSAIEPRGPNTGTVASLDASSASTQASTPSALSTAVPSSGESDGESSRRSAGGDSANSGTADRVDRREVTTATQVSGQETDGSKRSSVWWTVGGAVVLVAVIGAGFWAGAGTSGGDESVPAESPGTETPTVFAETAQPDGHRVRAAVDEARVELQAGLAGASRAAAAAADEPEASDSAADPASESAPPSRETPSESAPPSRETPSKTSPTASEKSSTGSAEHERKETAGESDSSGVEAFDEMDRSNGDDQGSSKSESSDDFEVEAWE